MVGVLLALAVVGLQQARSSIGLRPATAIFPQLLAYPTISGDVRAGGTVACGRGTWDDSPSRRYPVTYAWQREGQPIAGATGRQYLVKTADLGHHLACLVTAHSEDATNGALASVFPYPRNRLGPALQGSPTVGGTLSCSRGAWDERADAPYAITYRWLRDGAQLAGATTSTYKVPRADLGHSLACVAVAEGLAQAGSRTAYVYPVSLTDPSISGDPRVGGTLSCSRGGWDDPAGAPYAVVYRWSRDGVEVPSQTTSTYAVTPADLGRLVRCRVIAEGLASSESNSVSVYPSNRSAPVLSGDPRLGGTLTCSRGEWDERPGAPQFDTAYRWVRDGVPLTDQTQPTYKVTAADMGRSLLCRVTVAGLNSADTPTVTPQPRSILPPALIGDPRLGGTLTCSPGSWDERADSPYSFAYGWYRNGQPLGSTSSTHVVVAGDLGFQVSCSVTAQSLVTTYSESTGIRVSGLLAPAIAGPAYVGSTLSCSRGGWDERSANPYAVTYQWLRNGSPIEAAISSEYTLVAADLNTSITCVVTAEGFASQYSGSVFVAEGPPQKGANPVNLLLPQISGDPRLGSTLACSRGDWDDSPGARYEVSWRWFREYPYSDPQPAPVGLGPEHAVVQDDLGAVLWCVARTGGVEALTQIGISGPNSLSPPQILGDSRIGHTLTCTRGGWDDPAAPYEVSYAWYRSWPHTVPPPEVVGTGPTHVVDPGDAAAQRLYCLVTAAGARTALGTTAIDPPRTLVPPQVSGDVRVGSELTCDPGTWDSDAVHTYTITYQWYREYPFSDPEPESIESDATRTVTNQDLNRTLWCVVRADGVGKAYDERYVPQPRLIRAPEISGKPRIGGQLQCDRGIWDDPEGSPYPVSFAWYRDYPWTDPVPPVIDTGATHTVVSADLAHTLTCVVNAPGVTQAGGTQFVPGPEPVAPPAFDHEPRAGIATTCSRGSWDDPIGSPYPVTYAWYRDSIDDLHRVSSTATYTPAATDVGHYLYCVVRAADLTDNVGQAYVRTPEIETPPAILGDLHVGGRLACTRGDWDDEEGARYPVTYAWYRESSGSGQGPVPIGTTNHHTVTFDDVGVTVSCIVSAIGFSQSASVQPEDVQPILAASVDDDQPAPGGTVTVTLKLLNGGSTPLEVSRLRDRLFAGGSYVPGSASGAFAADPDDDGDDLTWTIAANVEPGEALVQRYQVKLSAGSADLVDRPEAEAGRRVSVPLRARVSPQVEPALASCTIVGTPGDDDLAGTPGDDVICGLGGDDMISGLGGADSLWGGDGEDRVDGGEGNDAVHGSHGNDVLIGGAGADLISGGGATDLVTYADRDASVAVSLGAGNEDDGAAGEHDTVLRDVERVRGGAGADTLTGDEDPNELDGRSGDDVLLGLGGIDDLIGDAGADEIDSTDANQELVDCGGGSDVVSRDEIDRVVGCEREG
jgi:hypothetical protein